MEIFAERANIWRQSRIFFNALTRLRQGYSGQGTTCSTFSAIKRFAFHNLPTLGDQKIARFLAKQRNCSRSRMAGRDGALRRPDIAARCPYLAGRPHRLVPSGIKLLLRQFRRCNYTVPIAFPKNSPETSTIGPTKVRY
jgi:hypothetical protein